VSTASCFQAYLRAHEESLSEEVIGRIELNPLRAFDADHEGTRRVMAGAPRLLEAAERRRRLALREVRELLDLANIAYEVDTTLVRGLDYYTRTVFEFTSDALGAPRAAWAGEAATTASVEQLGGPPTPGIGWAVGVERMLLAGDPRAVAPGILELFVAIDQQAHRPAAFAILTKARSAGLKAQMDWGPARSRASSANCQNALACTLRRRSLEGSQAVPAGHGGGGQERIATDTVVHAVLRGLRDL